ncbi:hypothetical protein BJ170DRAFT_699589 [Xylariales sp. AK1849]|nr:hypothetical protein BJ170DRAFT_699589 [Xylariales sp. AK1849]
MAERKTPHSHEYEVLCSTEETVRKSSDTFRIRREIEAMEYVRSRTAIPMPIILDKSINDNDDAESFILMKRIPGQQLQEAWPKLDENARIRTTHELHSYIRSCTAFDHLILAGLGPALMGQHTIIGSTTCPHVGHLSLTFPDLTGSLNIVISRWTTMTLSSIHADLSGENILVDPVSGSVTGIIDWEMAGFWPQWWEYRKVLFGGRNRGWWQSLVPKIMSSYDTETEVDMELEMY